MDFLKICGDILNLFSGTPWLLDVLNGFIAHNNVSNFARIHPNQCIVVVFINVVHHSDFSTIYSSSSLTWSTPSTASSSSSCSSRRRRCWRVCNGCGNGAGRKTEWRQCFRRPATSLSPSQARLAVCQVCQSTASSVKPRRCHKMWCELLSILNWHKEPFGNDKKCSVFEYAYSYVQHSHHLVKCILCKTSNAMSLTRTSMNMGILRHIVWVALIWLSSLGLCELPWFAWVTLLSYYRRVVLSCVS